MIGIHFKLDITSCERGNCVPPDETAPKAPIVTLPPPITTTMAPVTTTTTTTALPPTTTTPAPPTGNCPL